MAPQNVSDRVLVACATISQNNSDNKTGNISSYNFTQITGGFYLKHLSPHLKGLIPVGGTVGFKDAHASWRKFSDMDERAKLGGTSIGFWF
jgi:hypothetical protein